MTGYIADLSWKSGARAIEKLDRLRSTLAILSMTEVDYGSECVKSFQVPTSALNVDFIDFTQAYQTNVGELLEIWSYRKFITATFCHIISYLYYTNPLRIRTSDMPKN